MLEVIAVSVALGGQPVLRDISVTVESGEIICLLGPSGCGKTTLLRSIAGLQPIDSGDIRFDGRTVVDTLVHQRGFGLMFQEFALFPHLNVADNVAFGLRMHHWPRPQREDRIREVLALVGLDGFAGRGVSGLSGGERQRVALARSIAPNPRLLMLDEPLGSLDASLRERLAIDLRAIIKSVGLTSVYVTHDQQEAFAIADRVAVMNAGRIEQIASPMAIYRQPRTQFVARFLGIDNFVPVLHHTDGKARTPIGTFPVDAQPDTLLLHPRGIALASPDAPNAFTGTVQACIFRGDSFHVRLELDAAVTLEFSVPASIMPDASCAAGARLTIAIDPAAVVTLHA